MTLTGLMVCTVCTSEINPKQKYYGVEKNGKMELYHIHCAQPVGDLVIVTKKDTVKTVAEATPSTLTSAQVGELQALYGRNPRRRAKKNVEWGPVLEQMRPPREGVRTNPGRRRQKRKVRRNPIGEAGIGRLASKSGVKRIAVENFLSSLDPNMSQWEHYENLRADAASYKWNVATVKAITQGIRLAYGAEENIAPLVAALAPAVIAKVAERLGTKKNPGKWYIVETRDKRLSVAKVDAPEGEPITHKGEPVIRWSGAFKTKKEADHKLTLEYIRQGAIIPGIMGPGEANPADLRYRMGKRNPRRVSASRKRELLKKLPTIRAGRGVRPPKEWWMGMRGIIRQQYPRRAERAISRITAGVWHKYSPATKTGIIHRLAGGTGGIPVEDEENPWWVGHPHGAGEPYTAFWPAKPRWAAAVMEGPYGTREEAERHRTWHRSIRANPESTEVIVNRMRFALDKARAATARRRPSEAKALVMRAIGLWQSLTQKEQMQDQYKNLRDMTWSLMQQTGVRPQFWAEENPVSTAPLRRVASRMGRKLKELRERYLTPMELESLEALRPRRGGAVVANPRRYGRAAPTRRMRALSERFEAVGPRLRASYLTPEERELLKRLGVRNPDAGVATFPDKKSAVNFWSEWKKLGKTVFRPFMDEDSKKWAVVFSAGPEANPWSYPQLPTGQLKKMERGLEKLQGFGGQDAAFARYELSRVRDELSHRGWRSILPRRGSVRTEENPFGLLLPAIASGISGGLSYAATSAAMNSLGKRHRRNPEDGHPTRKEIQDATRVYETFHARKAKKMKQITVPRLEGKALTFLGHATAVGYFSDKWGRKGQSLRTKGGTKRGQRYIHEITAPKSAAGKVWYDASTKNTIAVIPTRITPHGIEDKE